MATGDLENSRKHLAEWATAAIHDPGGGKRSYVMAHGGHEVLLDTMCMFCITSAVHGTWTLQQYQW
jgi:hypothetical protein